jgi:hypothetical protein
MMSLINQAIWMISLINTLIPGLLLFLHIDVKANTTPWVNQNFKGCHHGAKRFLGGTNWSAPNQETTSAGNSMGKWLENHNFVMGKSPF